MKYINDAGLTYLWSKIKSYLSNNYLGKNATAAKATADASGNVITSTYAKKETAQATLTSSGWSLTNGYYYQTVSVTGITTSSIIIVSPASGYEELYAGNSVLATELTAGKIKFRAESLPSSNIIANVLKLG